MVADYFTKPLQVVTFRNLRNMIMGNTLIPLPSDKPELSMSTNDGARNVKAQSVLRSVLKSDSSQPAGATSSSAGMPDDVHTTKAPKLKSDRQAISWAVVVKNDHQIPIQ